jgi:hypothetical protein
MVEGLKDHPALGAWEVTYTPHMFNIPGKIFRSPFSETEEKICFVKYAELGTRFFYASRLRFRALWRSSSRWRFRALFSVLNFALLHSRFRAPTLLDFSRSFFALLDFSRFFSRSSIFRARTFAIIYFRARNFVLVRLYTARTGQPGQDSQDRTARTGQPEQDRRNRTG